MPAQSFDSISLGLDSLTAHGWKLEDARILLSGLAGNQQGLTLSVAHLRLPKPFEAFHLAKLSCPQFSWQDGGLGCQNGRAEIGSTQWPSLKAVVQFRLNNDKFYFQASEIFLLGGTVAFDAVDQAGRWQINLTGKNINASVLSNFWQNHDLAVDQGWIDLALQMSGKFNRIDTVNARLAFKGLALQVGEGSLASEDLKLTVTLRASLINDKWQWQSKIDSVGGGLYFDPVYLDVGSWPIAFQAEGVWQPESSSVFVDMFNYHQTNVGELQGHGIINIQGDVGIDSAELTLASNHVNELASIYAKPFLEQTPWEELSVTGELKAELAILQRSLARAALTFHKLDINDPGQRIGLSGGYGSIFWSASEAFEQTSEITWNRLKLFALPFDKARLSLLTKNHSVKLLNKTHLPLFNGDVTVNKFFWQLQKGQAPELFFDGSVHRISLEQLTQALHWAPMTGTLSGRIPDVEYRNRFLKLGGQLIVRVFDGVVKIADLSLSDLFSELPRLTANIELERLDMEQITRHFSFGGISGRVSGFINRLVLENWRPVTFFAWFGTPEDDDSRHRISQKAVNSIASIGGGGANILSGTVLRLFDTFHYDRLGFGCYLHQGICQLMGIEASNTGYALIKGGGLPRIDVIGYNSQVDWKVLVERLQRITSSNEVIIR